MPTTTQTILEELTAKRAALGEFFKAHKDESGKNVMAKADTEHVQAAMAEINDLGKKYELEAIERKNAEALADLDRTEHPSSFGSGRDDEPEQKSLGDLVVESKEYQASRGNGVFQPMIKMFDQVLTPERKSAAIRTKATMMSTVDWTPPNNRTDRVVLSAQRRVMLPDLIPSGQTSLTNIEYMEETTFTNGAGMRAEGAVIGESALSLTPTSNPVQWLPVKLPMTEQQLDDVPQVRDYVDNRLMYQLELTKESQLLNGSGTSPQLKGFLTRPSILTQDRGADDIPDAFLKAITLVRTTGQAEPSGGVMHPNDWVEVQLMRTADGIYIWGHPNAPTPEARLWGVPIVVAQAITEGTSLVGDFRGYSHISYLRGVKVDMGWVDDDFARGIKTIRMYIRLCLEIFRQTAFCKLTSM